MPKPTEEDLFAGTTMTFGEHLEELRVSLFRALIGLFIGCVIGFLIADRVVRWIQQPLSAALREHNAILAAQEMRARNAGTVPENFEQVARRQGLIAEVFYIEPAELARLATHGDEASEKTVVRPAPPGPIVTSAADGDIAATNLVKIRFWKAIQRADHGAQSRRRAS